MVIPRILSHRGGALLWPENSLAAFRNSLALPLRPGFDMLECDVHLSSDGVPVVIHDATLDRTAEASGPVAARDAPSLARAVLRGTEGEGVPSLAALAALVAGSPFGLQVEIKSAPDGVPPTGLLERSLAVLDAAGIRGRCGIIAFHAPTAAAAQRAGGLDHVAWLLEGRTLRDLGTEAAIAAARTTGVRMIEARLELLEASMVSAWRAAGFAVGCWGANTEAGIRRAMALGVTAMATDEPRLALAVRDGAAPT